MKTVVLALLVGVPAAWGQKQDVLRVPLRSRVEVFKGSGVWQEVTFTRDFPARATAVIVCDMWDRHWCSGAEKRVGLMAPRMNQVLERLRQGGLLVIHAPSNTMPFYAQYPQRRRFASLAPAAPPANLDLNDPPLPVDAATGGCDTPETPVRPYPWTRQHAAIRIAEEDWISDDGREIYGLFEQRGIRNLLLMGVHTNMCVLNRSFAIKQMTRWKAACVLVRDLTDAMYDPAKPPFVSHEQGTELVIQHIEKYWVPSTTSAGLLGALNAVVKP